MTLKEWITSFTEKFDSRELEFMQVHKGLIQLQLKDKETGNIELHNLQYTAKEAENLKVSV